MNENKNGDFEKEKWITPEINEISGLDSCVEFLYINPGDGDFHKNP